MQISGILGLFAREESEMSSNVYWAFGKSDEIF